LDEMLDKILDGDNPATVECEEKVKELPSQFTGWMQDNEQRIKDALQLADLTEESYSKYVAGRRYGLLPVIGRM